jgi:branched-chain amino acid transport system substrate-binding protein
MLSGAQVWVKWINARGGLNGHPVRLYTYDDGGDPARHRAQVQEAIEQRRAAAFLMNVEVISGGASVEYINAKGVPVVGTSLAEDWAYTSPMYFPQGSNGRARYEGFAASLGQSMIPKGKTKFGTLVCVEAQGCIEVERVFGELAGAYGYEHVYRGRTSLAQPDFTAECLAAANAGVEVLWVNLDTSSTRRLASACTRQGYHPQLATAGEGTAHDMNGDPKLDGLLAVSPVFPYIQTGTAATDEFQEAMKLYGNGIPYGAGPSTGWVAGKLLERAGARLSEPPTTASVLAGLWTIKDDTLGGLTAPLSFTENKPPEPVVCWFNIMLNHGTWTSPDYFRSNCR